MANVWALARRELQTYFASPIAYVVLALFALIFGFLFYAWLGAFLSRGEGGGFAPPPEVLNLNQDLIRWLLSDTSWLLIFLLPLLTMRSFSEEIRSGTVELLLTSPLTDFQIVSGKFLGALALFVAMLALTLLHMAVLFLFGDPEWQPIAAGYLGILLFGASLISLGLVFSSLTRNQIVAGILSLVAFLFLGFFQSAPSWAGGAADLFTYLSVTQHVEEFLKGVIDTRDVIYYLSFIGFGLFLSKLSLQSLRWRIR